jgi:hypothetical protein
MARSKSVGLILAAWDDADRVVAGLDDDAMVRSAGGESSFAWTQAHLANQLDAWINVRFQGRPAHPLIGQPAFRIGSAGHAENWPLIQAGIRIVREAARSYLLPLDERDLDRAVPYTGTLAVLQGRELSLRYALLRIGAHHYFHIGEIAAKRDRLGHHVGDYPGDLAQCL